MSGKKAQKTRKEEKTVADLLVEISYWKRRNSRKFFIPGIISYVLIALILMVQNAKLANAMFPINNNIVINAHIRKV